MVWDWEPVPGSWQRCWTDVKWEKLDLSQIQIPLSLSLSLSFPSLYMPEMKVCTNTKLSDSSREVFKLDFRRVAAEQRPSPPPIIDTFAHFLWWPQHLNTTGPRHWTNGAPDSNHHQTFASAVFRNRPSNVPLSEMNRSLIESRCSTVRKVIKSLVSCLWNGPRFLSVNGGRTHLPGVWKGPVVSTEARPGGCLTSTDDLKP